MEIRSQLQISGLVVFIQTMLPIQLLVMEKMENGLLYSLSIQHLKLTEKDLQKQIKNGLQKDTQLHADF